MPDSFLDGAKFALTGMLGGAVSMFTFFGRFQTKGDCKKAHTEHDKLDIERQKTRDEKLGRIHDAVERTEKLVLKMAGDFYKPRTAKTRDSD